MSTAFAVELGRGLSAVVTYGVIRAGLALLLGFLSASALAAANKLPFVTLTAPTNGASFTAPASITLTASASDPDGSVTKVDFFQGAALIGTRTTNPYTLTWSNVPGGAYTLTARATDNRGGTKTSTAASITVTGPKVLILSPASGAAVYGASVAVNGTFYGDGSTTVLVDNGNTTRVASVDGNTYAASIPVHFGANALRVVAGRRDRTSDASTVTVTGHGNPLLVFTAPATTVFDTPANIDLAIDAASPASTIGRVDFYRNGTLLGTATMPPYRYAWNSVGAGSYTVSAVATDALGATGTASLAITVNGANALPAVALTAPAGGASFPAPASIPMAASATDADGAVTLVEFLQNGNVVGTTNVAPYGVTWSNVPAGSYALTARATDDRSGTAMSAPVNVVVSPPNTPPTVTLTAPAVGGRYRAPATIDVAAAASDTDGSVARVDFYAGVTLIGTATSAPYSLVWSNVPAGTYALTARATDNGGAIATSAPVDVTVDPNSLPTVSLTSPASGASFFAPATIALAASAADTDGTIERIEFFEGTNVIGSATAAPFAYTWTQVPAGNYTITARARDDGGAVAASTAVPISVAASAMTITSPANGATIAGDRVTVSGTVQAPANSGVTVNGAVAAIDGTGHFHATGVPLVLGANTISVTLTTLAGSTASQSITVTSTGPWPMRIEASPTQGLAPLEVVFTVTPGEGTVIAKVEVDADGDNSIDRTLLAEPWTTSATYGGSGTALANVRVTDGEGVVRTETIPIVLTASAALDANLRAVWDGMKNALASGDKAAAMRYLDAPAQQRYGPVFDALLPNMPQIVASFSPPQSVMLSGGLGEYAINRVINGENRIFFVYFGRNGDGVWRLGSM